jgi:hypothetical protein
VKGIINFIFGLHDIIKIIYRRVISCVSGHTKSISDTLFKVSQERK